MKNSDNIVIIGAGAAGMACAYTLAKAGKSAVVIDSGCIPGGLCRTIDFGGYLFDIGGHRFLSKSDEINKLWRDIMDSDMVMVKRLSRIYYKKRFFNYPLSFFNTFWNFGIIESVLCIASYLRCRVFKPGNDSTFEGYIINRFGKRLYDIFFRTYTEKVWAIPCREISANWAKQRIKGLSLKVAIKKAVLKIKGNAPKTLSEEFLYPKKGPGEFYNRLEKISSSMGARFKFDTVVSGIRHNGRQVTDIEVQRGVHKEEMRTDHMFSSVSLPRLIEMLDPKPPEYVAKAAENLRFRNFLVVNIVLNKKHVFPDQWIYVHSPNVKLGRIQNYKNWSPYMILDDRKTSLGLEYFCTKGDKLWTMDDADLIHYAVAELEKIGILSQKYLINGFVVRCSDVYPIYNLNYQQNVAVIKGYLSGFSNFQTIGRCGLFRYDNSDHALLTGIYAARNFLGANPLYDIWGINTDGEYLES